MDWFAGKYTKLNVAMCNHKKLKLGATRCMCEHWCVFSSCIWWSHNARHSQHHTAHIYLIRQEADPVTFSHLFMMCDAQ